MSVGRKRIFHLITDLAVGGTPRVVESLVGGLDRTRFEVSVGCLLPRSRPSVGDSLDRMDVPVHYFDFGKRNVFWAFASLYGTIRSFAPDIIHTWLFHANVAGRIAGRLAGVPRIISSERAVDPLKTRVRVLLDRWTSRWAQTIIVNAGAVRDVLLARERLSAGKIVVVPNGVDAERFGPGDRALARNRLGIPEEAAVIVCVARLQQCKGHINLLRALAELRGRGLRPVLLLLGDGPERSRLEDGAKALGLDGQVKFLGTVDDVAPFLRAGEVFALPSLEEGMPGSVLEAMAAGLPVVATRVGGVPEVIDDRCGILVQPGSVKELAEGISKLLESPERRVELGNWGRRVVQETHSMEGMIKAYEALYSRYDALTA